MSKEGDTESCETPKYEIDQGDGYSMSILEPHTDSPVQ